MQRVDVWFRRTIPGMNMVNGIDYGNGTYVAVGDGIFTSKDGITWSRRYAPHYAYVDDVTFDGTRFVAIATERRPNLDQESGYRDLLHALISAADGATWHPEAVSSEFGGAQTIAAVPGICIAVGNAIWTLSADYKSWQRVSIGDVYLGLLHDICVGKDSAGKDLFVAVGQRGGDAVYCPYSTVSKDGIHWQKEVSYLEGILVSVAYGNGVFVAIGPDDKGLIGDTAQHIRIDRCFYKSTDGLHWTRQQWQAADDLNKIVFGSGVFVAVGAGGNVYVSENGEVWSVRNVGATATLVDVHYCGNCFIAASHDGTVFQSERFDQPFLELSLDGYGSIEVAPLSLRRTESWGFTCPRDSVITLKASGEFIPRWIKTPWGKTIELPTNQLTGFDGWTGSNPANSAILDTHNVIQVKMDADRHLTAHFSTMRLKPPTWSPKTDQRASTTSAIELPQKD